VRSFSLFIYAFLGFFSFEHALKAVQNGIWGFAGKMKSFAAPYPRLADQGERKGCVEAGD
jgi:hypothetical protein